MQPGYHHSKVLRAARVAQYVVGHRDPLGSRGLCVERSLRLLA
jgi:hypothetical protein